MMLDALVFATNVILRAGLFLLHRFAIRVWSMTCNVYNTQRAPIRACNRRWPRGTGTSLTCSAFATNTDWRNVRRSASASTICRQVHQMLLLACPAAGTWPFPACTFTMKIPLRSALTEYKGAVVHTLQSTWKLIGFNNPRGQPRSRVLLQVRDCWLDNL